MARALIVGCGCRGRALGRRLLAEGWQVRGTARSAGGLAAIEAAGLEAQVADPLQLTTILDVAEDATLVAWLLGSAQGEPSALGEVHGPKLERFLERSVETPLRRFVYEASGSVEPALLARGEAIVREAGERWSIPFGILDADPDDVSAWVEAAVETALGPASSAGDPIRLNSDGN